jgi:hypothetical protein
MGFSTTVSDGVCVSSQASSFSVKPCPFVGAGPLLALG